MVKGKQQRKNSMKRFWIDMRHGEERMGMTDLLKATKDQEAWKIMINYARGQIIDSCFFFFLNLYKSPRNYFVKDKPICIYTGK